MVRPRALRLVPGEGRRGWPLKVTMTAAEKADGGVGGGGGLDMVELGVEDVDDQGKRLRLREAICLTRRNLA